MRLLGYTLIQYDWCLYEKNRRNTGAALGEPHTVMNTESGGVELSAKDGKRFSATTEGGETQQGSAQSLGGSMALLTARIWTPSLQNWE